MINKHQYGWKYWQEVDKRDIDELINEKIRYAFGIDNSDPQSEDSGE